MRLRAEYFAGGGVVNRYPHGHRSLESPLWNVRAALRGAALKQYELRKEQAEQRARNIAKGGKTP
jgi:hypothetical protein